jgi:hypothetical protein
MISDCIKNYFNRRLARCFYNYKALKGFMGLVLTNLYSLIGVTELIHFELPQSQQPFFSEHSNQAGLNALMKNRRLNIELVLDQFDFQEDGRFFAIKFIDPDTQIYRVLRFVKDPTTMEIMPENFLNSDINTALNKMECKKFLWKLLLLRTFPLNWLY